MALGGTSYISVTWTTGDTLTETKLDNMVANDQAYDSHAANGILLNNDIGYYQKDAGGDNRECMNLDSSDILNIGDGTNMEVLLKTMASARVYLAAAQENLVDNTWTKVLLDTEDWDIGSHFASNKFTVTTAGKYAIKTQVSFSSTPANKNFQLAIYKNGAAVRYADSHSALAASVYVPFADSIDLAATNYVELYCRAVGIGANTVDVVGGIESTFLTISLESE